MMQSKTLSMIDISGADIVTIDYDPIKNVLHVNIDGICRLRAQRSNLVVLNDKTVHVAPKPSPLGNGY